MPGSFDAEYSLQIGMNRLGPPPDYTKKRRRIIITNMLDGYTVNLTQQAVPEITGSAGIPLIYKGSSYLEETFLFNDVYQGDWFAFDGTGGALVAWHEEYE